MNRAKNIVRLLERLRSCLGGWSLLVGLAPVPFLARYQWL